MWAEEEPDYRPLPVRVTGLSSGVFSGLLQVGEDFSDLSPLIAMIDTLRQELGHQRWAELRPWCDDGDPLTAGRGGLERLAERLCVRWCDGD